MGQWFGVFGPAGMPQEITRKLNAEITAIIKSPDVVEKINAQGGEVLAGGPDEFRAFLAKDTAHWSKLVKDAKIKVE
jgi:tripartite-type tricarboxylate transporter receptor subunit TctC